MHCFISGDAHDQKCFVFYIVKIIGEFHKRLKIDPDLNFSKVNSRGVHSINLFACEKYFFEKFEFICFKHFRALPFLFGVEAHKSVTNWCPPYNVYYI